MALTIEDRLTRLEERLDQVEATLARQKGPRIGLTIEEAKSELAKPVERGPEVIELFHRIVGRFEGPGDLSEHMRDYLHGERE